MQVLIAIPAFNESATVADVVRDVREHRPDDHVLVIDDGSHDGTAEVAAGEGATVVRLPFNCGVGAAMRTAFLFARRKGVDALVQVDADGQHDPASIKALLDGLRTADVVVGARGDSYPVAGPRRWAMSFLAWALTRIVGTPLTDVTSGFRAAGRRAIDVYAADYPSEYLGDTVESLVIAARAGLTVTQVDVVMRPRQGGRSSQGALMSTAYLSRSLLALVTAVTHRRQTPE